MFNRILYLFFWITPSSLLANEPKDWKLGFQKSASKSMSDIVWFHDYMLLPIITAITAFVLFLLLYVCVKIWLFLMHFHSVFPFLNEGFRVHL